jgi:hypothetical protein
VNDQETMAMMYLLAALSGAGVFMLGVWVGRRQPLEWRIAALHLFPGDLVVFRSDEVLEARVCEGIRARLQGMLPTGVRALVLTPPISDVSIMRDATEVDA